MEIYTQILLPKVQAHDKEVHLQQTKTKDEVKRPSRGLCYQPRTRVKMDFWNYQRWHRDYVGAETFSENTIKVFYKKEMLNIEEKELKK